jgi:hypothetical protein
MMKGELSAKHAREGNDAVPVVEDDDVPVLKEDDVMPVVNQDEAPVNPFGERDDWAVGIMNKAFLKIKHVLKNTGVGTLNSPQEEKVSSYVCIFHQLADVLE